MSYVSFLFTQFISVFLLDYDGLSLRVFLQDVERVLNDYVLAFAEREGKKMA